MVRMHASLIGHGGLMGYSCGFDANWGRDVGYGVPARCDHPGCGADIHRGLAYVCGGDVFGGEHGCGLYFCYDHIGYLDDMPQRCDRCIGGMKPFAPTEDVPDWLRHKLSDSSWAEWRASHADEVAIMTERLAALTGALGG
ncbi:hypothetical protein ACFXOH_23030 [Bacillus subtilis]